MSDEELEELMTEKHPSMYNIMTINRNKNKIVQVLKDNNYTVTSDGHYDTTNSYYEKHLEYIIEDIAEFKVHTETEQNVVFSMDDFKSGKQYLVGNSYCYRCGNCDDVLIVHLYNNKVILTHRKDKECYINKDYSVNFKVPKNGKMVISDWLGNVLTDMENKVSVNSLKGRYLTTKDAETKGFVHVEVGNTSPTLYKLQDGSYVVASTSMVGTEESDYEDIDETKFPGAVKVCDICTDLWWFTLSSVNHCEKLEATGAEYIGGEEFNMEAGEWECIVHSNNEPCFATFKKVK